jgi:hypothetical protein
MIDALGSLLAQYMSKLFSRIIACLVRIRAAFCSRLAVAIFDRLPNLEAADFTCASCLGTLKFSMCPKLRALDISSTRITALPGIETLQYLSANSVSRIKFPRMPNLRLLDYSPVEFDGRFKFEKFPTLEAVRLSNAGPRPLFDCPRTSHRIIHSGNPGCVDAIATAPGHNGQNIAVEPCGKHWF